MLVSTDLRRNSGNLTNLAKDISKAREDVEERLRNSGRLVVKPVRLVPADIQGATAMRKAGTRVTKRKRVQQRRCVGIPGQQQIVAISALPYNGTGAM